MSQLDEQISERFHHWEMRGRGWTVFPQPVAPEPPFIPFPGHGLPDQPVVDDGRRPTFLSSLVRKLIPPPPAKEPELIQEAEPEPDILVREPLTELQASLPADFDISREAFEHFLLNLSLCCEPLSLEFLGIPKRVTMGFAAHVDDAPLVRRQLAAHFPEGIFQTGTGMLDAAWNACEGGEALVVEFGLAREFMYSLQTRKLDPFVGIIGALGELQESELGLFQVMFQPVAEDWAENIMYSVCHADGRAFFVNEPELADAAKHKVARPLFAAVVRIAVSTKDFSRTLELARNLAGSLRVFANPSGNELIPLENDEYPFEEHIEDVLRRQSRRSGMILNADELIGLVHLPGTAVRSPVFERRSGKTKAAPASVRQENGVLLGTNTHAGDVVPVRLSREQRVRHTHVIGVHGTGKSTLLFNLVRQDIENGDGLAVLDPHGDLIEQILGIIPENRIQDVVLVDPSDEEYSVGFNILSAHSSLEKNLLASDLVSVFRRLSTSWGDQLGSVLQNAILAFLEKDQGGTLAELRRFLLEPSFREQVLQSVRDEEIVYYWRKGFPQLAGNKSIGSVITRLNEFLAPKPIRNMVSQKENRLDFANILDSGKIFLAKLSHGQIGRENSFLLGSLFVAKFQQIAMSRQAQRIEARRDFWLYMDEFQNFITPSMSEILTEARKYRLGLILAHQELRQLERDREVASAVLSNPCTRIVFRVGDADARALENGFSFFEARDLQNLETGQAICRVEKADGDFNLTVRLPDAIDPLEVEARRAKVIAASRAKYGRRVSELVSTLETPVAPKTDREPSRSKTPAPLPQPSEPTVSEKEKPVVPQPEIKTEASETAKVATKSRPAADDRGIGGQQHNIIRERIESVARELGFTVMRERQTPDGKKIDLALERPGELIGCEISIMTTVDWEVGNAAKCLKAGCRHVAMICPDETKLRKIEKAVKGSLPKEELERIAFYLPDRFIEFLKTLKRPAEADPAQEERAVGKYVVRRRQSKLTAEEVQARESAAHQVIAKAMRRPRDK